MKILIRTHIATAFILSCYSCDLTCINNLDLSLFLQANSKVQYICLCFRLATVFRPHTCWHFYCVIICSILVIQTLQFSHVPCKLKGQNKELVTIWRKNNLHFLLDYWTAILHLARSVQLPFTFSFFFWRMLFQALSSLSPQQQYFPGLNLQSVAQQ